ncbi:MAG: hypothetical protein HY646_19140, partial [Acidobacteria bacterium]|nr:hypothetical protein [Acidobacteriota bacterium]
SFPVTTDLTGAVGLNTFRINPTASYDYATAPRFQGMDRLSAIPLPAAPRGGFPATPPSETDNTGFMVDTALKTPHSVTMNFSISRDLPAGFTVETAYVGRLGRNLLIKADFSAPLVNFVDPRSGQTWEQALAIIGNLVEANAPTASVAPIPFLENVFAPMTTSTRTATQSFYAAALGWAPSWTDLLYDLDTRTTPTTIYGRQTFFQQQFNSLPAWTNLGSSSYHSFQLIVRKRMTHGLMADFNYTLSKSIDNGSAVENEGRTGGQIANVFRPRDAFRVSNFDIRHQVNSNFSYQLPFGRERQFGSNVHPVVNGIIGGWQLTGLLRWRTGFPVGVGNGFNFPTNYFVTGPATLRPGSTAPTVEIVRNAEGGPNAFANPSQVLALFQHTPSGGSGSRNVIYGPGAITFDSGVHKVFNIDESRRLVFRWETFNVTNTANLSGFTLNIDSPSTFGRFSSTAGSPRIMQFALRLEF